MISSTYQGFAYFYDTLMEEAPYDKWLHFLLRTIAEKHPQAKKILDLGCGTGRMAVAIAKQGFEVTGVDLSEEMLTVATERMIEEKTSLTLINQDMRELNLHQSYDVVYSFLDCVNYLLEEVDVQETFYKVAEHLQEGGLFIFDVHSFYKIREVYASGPLVQEDEEIAYIWVPKVDRELAAVDHHLHFFIQEEADLYSRISEIHRQRTFSIQQYTLWLAEVGLELIQLTADFTEESPMPTSERLFFVAKKRNVVDKQ